MRSASAMTDGAAAILVPTKSIPANHSGIILHIRAESYAYSHVSNDSLLDLMEMNHPKKSYQCKIALYLTSIQEAIF